MAQDYDKIVKEIFRNAIVPFMSEVLGQEYVPIQDIEPKMQKTVEREPDFFKIVKRPNRKKPELLHVEWQLKGPWKRVRNRMMFYKVLGIDITDLPVKQYVLYMGKGRPKATTVFKDEDMDYRYQLIPIKSVSYQKLLNAKDTGVALFAILADFEEQLPEYIIEQISKRILEDAAGELEIQLWQKQLEIISNIHNLQELTVKILERMPIVYNLKTDVRYQQGIERGIEKGIEKGKIAGTEEGMDKQATIMVINMLLKTDFSTVQIAELAGVEHSFVKKWQKELRKLKLKDSWNSFNPLNNNQQKIAKRATMIAAALCKIKSLPIEVIAKVTDLTEKEVQKIIASQKKNQSK